MKHLITLCLALSLGIISLQAQVPGQGSDAFGYQWFADSVAGGPTYNWVDISSHPNTIEIQNMADDNFAGPFNLGFSFRYFWLDYTQIYIGSNGYVMFNRGVNIASDANGFPAFPTPGPASTPNNFIGLLLSDLTFTDVADNPIPNAKLYFYTNNTDSAVITFENVPFWTNDNPQHYQGSNTFQLILNGADRSFTLQYQSSQGQVHSSYINAWQNNPSAVNFLTRGYENVTGALGATVSSNSYPTNQSAIKVVYPTTVTYQVRDVQADRVLNANNTAQHVVIGDANFEIFATVKNTGTVNIPAGDVIEVRASMFDYTNANTPFSRDTVFISSGIPAQGTSNVSLNLNLPTNKPGNYRVSVEVVLTGDQVLGNNFITGEVLVVDTAGGLIEIAYDRFQRGFRQFAGAFPPYQFPGVDGISTNLRVGQYLESPIYPIEIKQLEFDLFSFNLARKLGFTATVFADDGPNGTPGTQLFRGTVNGADIFMFQGQVTSVPINLPSPILLEQGGVYIMFELEENPDNELYNGLVVDQDGPASFRTYEITGGAWAPYRDAPNSDFAIRFNADIIRQPDSRSSALAQNLSLGQNYPNPVVAKTHIPYQLAVGAEVVIEIRNMAGQLVARRELGYQAPGEHLYTLSTANMASGTYTYSLNAGGVIKSQRMIVAH